MAGAVEGKSAFRGINKGAIMEQAKPKRLAVRKFRSENPRIDYFPTPDAVSAIERLRQSKPGVCTRELLDMLIVEGGNVWFPERVGTRK